MTDKIYVSINDLKVEATGEILQQILADRAEAEEIRLITEAKATARESALAKLAALGLTEEEIAAL